MTNDSLWLTASADTDAEVADRRLAMAKVSVADVWPFLAAARSEQEYAQRLAMAAPQIEAAVEKVAGSDVALVESLSAQVLASLAEDFATHTAARTEIEALARVQAALVTEAGTSTYCPTHGVYVGAGNQEQHDHCKTEQRKTKDASADPGSRLPFGREAGVATLTVQADLPCLLCGGERQIDGEPCPSCDGTGIQNGPTTDEDYAADYTGDSLAALVAALDDEDVLDVEATMLPVHWHRHPARTNDPFASGDGRFSDEFEEEGRRIERHHRSGSVHTADNEAPYRIEQRGSKWVVVNDNGDVKGTFDSQDAAREQQKALYANVPGAKEKAEKKSSSLATVACRKCTAGHTPDGADCGYCDGVGSLDPTTAMIKAADGWDQGITRQAFVRTAEDVRSMSDDELRSRINDEPGDEDYEEELVRRTRETGKSESERGGDYRSKQGAAEMVECPECWGGEGLCPGGPHPFGDDCGSPKVCPLCGGRFGSDNKVSKDKADAFEAEHQVWMQNLPERKAMMAAKHAVNTDATGTDRYQRTRHPAKPGWVNDDWTDGKADQATLDTGRAMSDSSAWEGDLPAATRQRVERDTGAREQVEQAIETTGAVTGTPKVHTFGSTREAYDRSQTDDSIHDGDVLSVPSEGVHGFLLSAWPVAVVHPASGPGEFHTIKPGVPDVPEGYEASFAKAKEVAGSKTTGSAKTADVAAIRMLLSRLDGNPVRLTYTSEDGVGLLAGRLSYTDGNAVLTTTGGAVHSVPGVSVLSVEPTGYYDLSGADIEGAGREPSAVDYAFSGAMPSGAWGARKTANPYTDANPYASQGPGNPGSDMSPGRDRSSDDRRDDRGDFAAPAEPMSTRPRVKPSGPASAPEFARTPDDDTFAGDNSGHARVDTSTSAPAGDPIRTGSSLTSQVHARLDQMTQAVLASNPGMERTSAVAVAVRTLRDYPSMIRVAHAPGQVPVVDYERALQDYVKREQVEHAKGVAKHPERYNEQGDLIRQQHAPDPEDATP